MNKKDKALIISILKPADEPRMAERLGMTLNSAGYIVHIAGQSLSDSSQSSSSPIKFHPIFHFTRLSIKRIFAPLSAFWLSVSIRPSVIIICTPELLKIFAFYKIFFNVKIYYDVQENYYLNMLNAQWHPPVIRHLLAGITRLLEWVFNPFLSGIFLAENSYRNELPFLKNKKWILLENKMWQVDELNKKIYLTCFPRKKKFGETIHFLFTGTLDQDTGVFVAIDFIKKIHNIYPQVSLKIIGSVTRNTVLFKLLEEIKDTTYIQLRGGNQFVQHDTIVSGILDADFGIIAYNTSPHIQQKFPTKLFEYLSCGLPVITNHNPVWESVINKTNAGFSIDFCSLEINTVLARLFHEYYAKGPDKGSLWSDEKNLLINFLG